MEDSEFREEMTFITTCLLNAGYSPRDQLTGYLSTGQDRYITRFGNARELIKRLDQDRIRLYLREHFVERV